MNALGAGCALPKCKLIRWNVRRLICSIASRLRCCGKLVHRILRGINQSVHSLLVPFVESLKLLHVAVSVLDEREYLLYTIRMYVSKE